MTTEPAFSRLREAVDRYLRPALLELGFRESGREPAWYGGGIAFELDGLVLGVSYEVHDMGLGVRLGTPPADLPPHVRRDVAIPDYTEYTAALGIPDERFRDACGGWRTGGFKVEEFDVAFGFVASTLPIILPRQQEIEAALREREQAKRKERRRRPRRPKSS